ncbi:MAG: sporulation protein YabP [Massiliimalia sp.]
MTEQRNISSAQQRIPHNLILEERKNLSVSGVTDVVSFDEQSVALQTQRGGLVIRGEGLHISKASIETGEVILDGEIDELIYTAQKLRGRTGGGFFARMFRQGDSE